MPNFLFCRQLEVIRFLVSQEGIELNSCSSFDRDDRGKPRDYSALHYAAEAGHLDCAKVLVEAGADKSTKSSQGRTALEVAKSAEMKALLQ